MNRRTSDTPQASLQYLLIPLLAVGLLAWPAGGGAVEAQSVMERPPNMHGLWTGRSGTVYFNFLHRFTDTGAPLRKVLNYPTFLLAAGLPGNVLVGVRYATNSELVPQVPNEWEAFARYAPLREAAGFPVSVSLQGAFNEAARSWDGELELGRRLGPARLFAAGRAFSNGYGTGEAKLVVAGGGAVQLLRYLALAADYALPLDDDDADAAWGIGLQTAIPYTPHSLSFQVSNASTTTTQGASLGFARRRWGFEFTVPLTLSRYFGAGGGEVAAAAAPGGRGGEAAGAVTEVGMNNRLEFTPDTVRIRVGETLRWRNTSDVMHTVTADPSKAFDEDNVRLPAGAETFDSGDMPPGAVFEHTFRVPGVYTYICIPHELAGMVGTVVVME